MGVGTCVQKVHSEFNTRSARCRLSTKEVLAPGKQPKRVKARSLLCYWAFRELRMSCTVVAERLGMTQPGVSKAVQRGEGLAERDNFEFIQGEERNL